MLKTLIRKQLLELFQTYYVSQKTGKARSRTGTVLFFGLLFLLFLGLGLVFFGMAQNLGRTILGQGVNWLFFALMGLLSMALGVFGSVFNTYASLYLPKDNEFLISLPIPPRTLLLARTSGVYVTSLMYSAWVWIPVTAAYWVLVTPTVSGVVFPILLTFVIALFVSVLSCLLGWVVALVSVKVKGKSFLTVLFSLAVMALYYVVYFNVVGSLNEIVNHLDSLETTVRSWMHYVWLLGLAADGDALSMLLVTGITAGLAVLCFAMLSRSFPRLAVAGNGAGVKTENKADYTQRKPQNALVRRELAHFAAVPTWMLNGGFGLLLPMLLSVAAVIKCGALRELLDSLSGELPELIAAMPVLILAAVCMMLSSNALSPVSVSMEGNSLWVLQALPLSPRDILRAKEKMAVLLIEIPGMIALPVLGFVMRMKMAEILLMTAAVWLFARVSADFGLFLNLKQPNFHWTNEATLTKQSMPVVINMFGSWAFCIALGYGGTVLCGICGAPAALAAENALFLLLWVLLRLWLKTKGEAVFRSL